MRDIRIEYLIDESLVNKLSEQLNHIRSREYFSRCLRENIEEQRLTAIAFIDDVIVGHAHLIFSPEYPYFNEEKIPELSDLGVLPEYRNRGIANLLMDDLEGVVRKKFRKIGLGVGLYKDYGNAQSLYCKRGYVADGRGIQYRNKDVKPGSMVKLDDDLLLYFVKTFKE